MTLVTGPTGVLGTYLLLQLTASGQRVRALHRPSSNLERVKRLFAHWGREADFRLIDWVKGDVLDTPSLDEALDGITHAFHCAAVVSFSPSERDFMWKVNVEGTANVVNCALAAGVKKLCHVSSVAALGRKGTAESITENTPWTDSVHNSAYGQSKRAAEMEVWRGMEEGLEAIVVNPCIIIGAGTGQRSSERLFAQVDEGLKYYGPGINSFVDVRDVALAMQLLMQGEIVGQRFIVAAHNAPFKTLFDLMADALGKPRPTILLKPWMGQLAWRLFAVQGALTGKAPFVTRETVRTAFGTSHYTNTKLLDALPGFSYRPLQNTVNEMAWTYRSLKA